MAPPPTPPNAALERIVLRPIGNPLPLGFVGFAVGAFVSSALVLHWIPRSQGAVVAAVLLAFTTPLQLLAAVLGLAARDTSGATAQGTLAAIWGAFAVALVVPGGGTIGAGVGVFWLAAAFVVAMLAAASWSAGRFFAVILTVSSARYLLEGIAAVGGATGAAIAAGLVGLAQAALGSYAALALLLESSKGPPVLPLLSAEGERSVERQAVAALEHAVHEPGVRRTM